MEIPKGHEVWQDLTPAKEQIYREVLDPTEEESILTNLRSRRFVDRVVDVDGWGQIMRRRGYNWRWVLGWVDYGYPDPLRWLVEIPVEEVT